MNDTYQAAAQAYAEGVRGLFAPTDVSRGDRGARGPTSYEELAGKAESLSSVSDDLAKVITVQLTSPDPAVQMEGSTRMLAKALTDLEVSTQLLQAAEDEGKGVGFTKRRSADRSVAGLKVSKEYLNILLGEAKSKKAERSTRRLITLGEARTDLSTSIGDAMKLISERAGKTSKSALDGLLGLGMGEVAKAAGALGMSIAEALGQAEKVSRLYQLFRSFLKKVYDALLALVGETLLQKAGEKVLDWVNELKEGKRFQDLLEKLYQTGQTNEALKKLIQESKADLGKFAAAIQQVNGLKEGYGKQISLIEKLLKGIKFLGGAAQAALPQGTLILAAAYVSMGGYVVLAGADYVDSPQIKWLERIPGVRRVVETNLT